MWDLSSAFQFTVTHRDGAARRGELRTPHGVVQTPVFMPVGTRGAVKAVTHRDLEDLGAEIILGNTYHLFLRPAAISSRAPAGCTASSAGTARSSPTAAAIQVFSLATMRKIREEGAEFRSHLDGALHLLTPERATDIQAQLGSDIAMVLDECIATPATRTPRAMPWSARFAGRARAHPLRALRDDPARSSVTNPGQAQFGIVQGGDVPGPADRERAGDGRDRVRGLRHRRAERRRAARDVMYDVVGAHGAAAARGPAALPDGHGMPDDLFECVARGIDMFDCVLPTRNARNGQFLTSAGPLSIKNARFAEDLSPPDPAAAATPAGPSRAPISGTFIWPER